MLQVWSNETDPTVDNIVPGRSSSSGSDFGQDVTLALQLFMVRLSFLKTRIAPDTYTKSGHPEVYKVLFFQIVRHRANLQIAVIYGQISHVSVIVSHARILESKRTDSTL